MTGSRRLGVAMDFSPCSIKALQWVVDNIAREGDTIILIIINPEEYEHGEMQLWAVTGSRKKLLNLNCITNKFKITISNSYFIIACSSYTSGRVLRF